MRLLRICNESVVLYQYRCPAAFPLHHQVHMSSDWTTKLLTRIKHMLLIVWGGFFRGWSSFVLLAHSSDWGGNNSALASSLHQGLSWCFPTLKWLHIVSFFNPHVAHPVQQRPLPFMSCMYKWNDRNYNSTTCTIDNHTVASWFWSSTFFSVRLFKVVRGFRVAVNNLILRKKKKSSSFYLFINFSFRC